MPPLILSTALPTTLSTTPPPVRPAAPAGRARRWLAGLALAGAALPALAASTLPGATDLGAQGREATRRGGPLVLLLSLPGCGYCETVRRNYLGPMAAAGEITARELDIGTDAPLRDADGTMTGARAWARARGLAFAPTVLFLDAHGREAAPPLRGLQPDFYGAYLEQRLEAARAALAGPR
ncbi:MULTISPECIES: thioredoxin [Cupriavidus]|uniref:thioredoxin n=1 Tax=Cupriavidus TaxID=106589 RepID=UPI000A7D9897|nr:MULTISPECIES: thioredoxin [Cupriavidus]